MVVSKSSNRATGEQESGLYARDGGRKYLNRAERSRALASMAELEPDKARG
jgi:hypothetical protein